ncbi:unnamed protein product [Owenia fusiformis]|uniref:Uncharacterized protein n=1 Tax=Owenia fusiformis TaxID=6347 RepID=A0A8J1T7S1_OWEFU|nr:unnamed protein product [Owenia fusiformis]
MKVCAIVPIKHHSSRVPGKNYRVLEGKPLYYYVIRTLLDCKHINQVVVDTDSPLIIEGLEQYFQNNVTVYPRPKELQGDDVPTNALLMNVITKNDYDADYYLQTHVTNPLITVKTIDDALERFMNNDEGYDSAFSVMTHHTRLYNKDGGAMNHNPKELIPTQDLDPIYEENSCIYIFSKASLLEHKHRIGAKPMMIKMSDIESTDIDWEDDFIKAGLLVKMRNDQSMEGRVVLITGVGGGIGTAVAMKFKQEGWYVVGMDIKHIEQPYVDRFIQTDISKPENCQAAIASVMTTETRLDCLVNNAAIQICKKVVDTECEDWDRTMNVNARAMFLLSKYAHDMLQKSSGSIVNVSSVHAHQTSESIVSYATSKGAVSVLTRAMSLEYARDSIRVNAVLPGATDTGMLRSGLSRGHVAGGDIYQLISSLGSKHVVNRIGQPSEIAEAIYFLADGRHSSFVIGQSLVVDGGATIRLSTE